MESVKVFILLFAALIAAVACYFTYVLKDDGEPEIKTGTSKNKDPLRFAAGILPPGKEKK